MRKWISVLMALLLVMTIVPMMGLAVSAENFTEGVFVYVVEHGGAKIVDCETVYGTLVIPASLGGYSVKEIEMAAFKGQTHITAATIPEGVEIIGSEAFYGCSSLANISIPDSVTGVYERAFDETAFFDNQLNWENGMLFDSRGRWVLGSDFTVSSNLVIPEGTVGIADRVFQDNSAVNFIDLPSSLKTIGWKAFEGTGFYNTASNWTDGFLYSGTWLISVDVNVSGAVEIRPGTTKVAELAFEDSSVTEVTIPDSLTELSWGMFQNCTSLQTVTIPDTVTRISMNTFAFCTMLKEITIPDSVVDIHDDAFFACEGVVITCYPDSAACEFAVENGFDYETIEKPVKDDEDEDDEDDEDEFDRESDVEWPIKEIVAIVVAVLLVVGGITGSVLLSRKK